jgi:DNA-binding transcriptional MerR regulator/methylmalonyl-CoA mutase cobalamin-binding subunit
MAGENLYPMKAVARRTGLSPHVIRVWERRYEAVSPSRSPTNRRLYSDEDLERLTLLAQATRQGHSIGQIARIDTSELRRLAGGAAAGPLPSQGGAGTAAAAIDLDSLVAAVERFDGDALEEALSRAAVAMSRPRLFEDVIAALMNRIGELWQNGRLRVAHEHLATAVVRSFFGKLSKGYEVPASAPGVVVTTPVGQNHEVGALIAEAAAQSVGWRVAYLGPNLPAEEIAAAVNLNRARAVALSLVYPPDDTRIADELRKLRAGLPEGTVLFAGGRSVLSYSAVLAEIGAVVVATTAEFCEKLNALRK